MKKIISLTLILLLLVTALVGCGGGATDVATDDEKTNVESNEPESTPEESEEPAEEVVYEDGVYQGEAEGMHLLKVAVEVVDGKVAKVDVVEQEESVGVAEPALEQIPVAIVENNSTNVDVVSGATFTSNGIMDAVKNALEAGPVAEEVVYTDGVYEGEAEGMHHLKVAVEVVDGKIAKVDVVEQEESVGVAEPALEQIPVAIVEKNSTSVDVVSGATFTSNGIMDAVKNALESAK